MSREWSRETFAPAEVAPQGFVPQGFAPAGEPTVLSAAALAERMRAMKPGFHAVPLGRPMRSDAFVAGTGPSGIAPHQHRDAPAADEAAIAVPVTAAQPVPAPQIDAQAVFDAGIVEGERRATLRVTDDADACARLLASAAGAQRFDRAGLAQRLRQTVLHLVTQIVGEAGVSPERLGSRVDEAVRLLADVTEPARLSLHPDDLAMMQGRLGSNIAAVSDAAMERGGFRLETLSATIEDGPALWLEQLEAALDRVAGPGE